MVPASSAPELELFLSHSAAQAPARLVTTRSGEQTSKPACLPSPAEPGAAAAAGKLVEAGFQTAGLEPS